MCVSHWLSPADTRLGCLVYLVFANFDTLRFFSIRFSRYKPASVRQLFKNLTLFGSSEKFLCNCPYKQLFRNHFLRFLQDKQTPAMGLSGLEPPTSRLSGVRSNRLSYKPGFANPTDLLFLADPRRDLQMVIRQPPALPCRLQHSTIGRLGLNILTQAQATCSG